MAIFNNGVRHEMVDGSVYPEEVSNHKLGGVPSVLIDGELIHSGRGNLGTLVDKLEARFGTDSLSTEPTDLGLYDVAVIGGGPAGASAAIYSARKGLKQLHH